MSNGTQHKKKIKHHKELPRKSKHTKDQDAIKKSKKMKHVVGRTCKSTVTLNIIGVACCSEGRLKVVNSILSGAQFVETIPEALLTCKRQRCLRV